MDVAKPQRTTRIRSRWLAGALAAVVLLLLLGWAFLPGTETLSGVHPVEVRQGDLHPTLGVLGSIRPLQMRTITAQSAGRVVKVPVKPGQAVHKGDILLVLANENLHGQLATARTKYAEARSQVAVARAQAKSDIGNARAQLRKAQATEGYQRAHYEASIKVEELSVISRMQLAQIKSRLDMAVADTEAADIALDSARKVAKARTDGKLEEAHALKQALDRQQRLVDALQVRAPADGFIADKQVDAGASVTAGAALATFVDTSGYYVQLKVPEDTAGSVHLDDKVTIDIDQRTLAGHVKRISPLSKKGYVIADAHFDTPPADLPPIDSTVQATIHGKTLHDVLYVNAPDGISDFQTAAVYVARPDSHRARLRKVRFGARVGRFVIILDGLAKGDRILDGVDSSHGATDVRF